MTGESTSRDRIVREIERQTVRRNHLSTADIAESYAPQITALSHPRRTTSSPD